MSSAQPAYVVTPAFYERYMVPMQFAPHAQVLAARLADLTKGAVLETAAGTGVVTRNLVALLPASVAITATDLNQKMLDEGARHPDGARVTWRQADALSLPFPDRGFDAVISQFGVMFFPDKRAAFREALRVLAPGGRFVFNVWDSIEKQAIYRPARKALAPVFPQGIPKNVLAPWSYCDRKTISSDLAASGFVDIEMEDVPAVSRAPSARDAAVAHCMGGVLANAIEANWPGRIEEAIDLVTAELEAGSGEGPIAEANHALLITTRRPAN